jgi:hypothetical protein
MITLDQPCARSTTTYSRRKKLLFVAALGTLTSRYVLTVVDTIRVKLTVTLQSNLDRLPVFRSYKMSHPDGECDACKRSMHTASWQVVLEGVPYDATSYWKDGPTAVRTSVNE